MNYSKERKIIKNRIFTLQDKVADQLLIEKDVDKFLDNTTLLDEWENIIPDPEYGIFVIAVLNNIRTKTVIDTIVDSILKIESTTKNNILKPKRKTEQHPFC
jgi:methylaspartate ammonia-lyase